MKELKKTKFLVVGSGFFGSVIAERITNDLNEEVLVIDKRPHIGGNCFSEDDAGTGIHYHKYGTHIFHTNNRQVWDYINHFTEFNGYFHQVLTTYKNKVYQMPINLETINSFYGINLKPYQVRDFLKREISRDKVSSVKNFEEKAISLVGRPLYEAFIKGYTKKQWQKDPRLLPEELLSRLPFRVNYNESYYFSRWQGVPLGGYTEIFKKLLKSRRITLELNTDYFKIRKTFPESTFIVYSGPIDEYFGYKYGKLDWRSLEFKKQIIKVDDFQGTSVMNYAQGSVPYTRIHEPKHLHPERKYTQRKTLIITEYPDSSGKNYPCYPVNDARNQRLASKYKTEAGKLKNVLIGGRLGDYKYYDMHEVILLALKSYENRIKRNFRK